MELFKLFGTIALNNSDANKGIEKTTNLAEGAAQSIGSAFEKIGSAAVAVGKTVAVGVGAAATAISALTKEAVQGYADYEQLVGGVDTLFKNFSGLVQRNAENAYKTAGLSANEYMETVTSFSASLIQSLEGNTYAAAKYADMAITDMSDNANKMGTAMSSIQNAYQGFAKQNYTMLDNLKLGYGGTAAEMYRLLSDAKEIDETFDAVFSLDEKGHLEAGYADIVKAINIVQKEMGITGTTAKEAAATISGSLSMTKSAWKNLVVGIADENANLGELIDEFVESVGIAAENIIPRIEVALEGAAKMVDRLLPVIVDRVPSIINEVLPDILQSAASIVRNLVKGIGDNKDLIVSAAYDTVSVIVATIGSMLPEIFAIGLDMLVSLADGIVKNIDQITSSAVEVVLKIVDVLTNPETLGNLLDAAITIILAIADGLVDALPRITDATISVITKIVDTLTEEETLSKLVDAAVQIIIAVADGMIQNLAVLAEAAVSVIVKLVDELTKEDTLEKLIDATIVMLETIADGLIENLPKLIEAAIELVAKLVEYLLDPENMSKLLTTAFEMVSELCEGLLENAYLLEEKAGELGNAFADTFLNLDWESVGRSALNALLNGMALITQLDPRLPDVYTPDNPYDPAEAQRKSQENWSNFKNAIGIGSHASGLDYVPYDGYVAELHKGEMVVPAMESRYLRSGGLGSANAEVLMMLERILYAVQDQDNKNISLSVNNREFARLVKAVN